MPESPASETYHMPHDGVLVLRQNATAESPVADGRSMLGEAEVRLALRVNLVCQVVLASLAALSLLGGDFHPGWLAAALAALASTLLWGLGCRLPVYPRTLGIWRLALFAMVVVQLSAWLPTLVNEHAAFSVAAAVALIVASLPLWIWPLGLLLLFAMGVGLQVSFSDMASPVSVLLLCMLPLGLIPAALLRRQWREAVMGKQAAQRRVAEMEAELADQTQRAEYAEDQRLAQAQDVQAVRELADSANRAKTEFLATISHEIRTPLNGILPILEILRDTKLDDEQARYVSTAFSSSQHLLRIIDDILDFAKADSGKLQLENIEVDLRELTDSVVELMRRSAVNKGLKLSVNIEGRIPRVLRGDPSRLRQILTNLISNAIKFTEKGEVSLSVSRRRASRKEVELLFQVTDTGVGMSRESARKLFQSFTQADASTTRKHGGTGLGLAICKRLVELMGGKIGVRAQLGQGSTFWFVLPMRKSVMDVPTERRDLRGVRVMTLIPDVQVSEQVSRHLRDWGVKEESVALAEVSQRLHASALLGSTWSFELLLIDSWGAEQAVANILREVRADPLLKKLHVLVANQSENALERMHQEFSVYTLSGGLQAGPLQRCLHRLFDVEVPGRYASNDVAQPAYRDLNVQGAELIEQGLQAQPSPEQSGRPSVLLVEDNPVNLAVVQRVLERFGLAAVVAHNGREALDRLADSDLQLVLMDCQMPIMDGYQATIQWREIEQQAQQEPLPIIAMTANAMQGDREKCLEAGMSDYLAKPVSIEQLRQMLLQWMPDGWLPSDALPGELLPRSTQPVLHPEGEVLDPEVLSELGDVMGDGLDGLIRTYLQNAPMLMTEIDGAISRALLDDLVGPVHSLKSSSANLGAMRLSAQAREVEQLARSGEPGAFDAARALPGLFAEARDALREQLLTQSNSEA